MAKKRLNKKVALIGSVVFVFFMLGAILLFLYLSRDPEKFIKDGDAAVKAAHEAIDEQIKKQEYERAERSYHKARSLAKTDLLKVDMLFKLVDLYMETDQWQNVHGCWNRIISIDPKNIKARLGRLRYYYIMANSVGGRAWQWQEVESQASEFIEVVESMDLLMEETAKWKTPRMRESETDVKYLGPYLYLCRGRSLVEMASLGGVMDPDALLVRAVGDLEKARELQPTNVEIYSRLARAFLTEGEILASRGDIEGRNEKREKAKKILEQAIKATGNDVRAHIDLLAMKSMFTAEKEEEQLQSLEPEYLSLVEEFSSSAQAYSALSGFYINLGHKYLDKARKASEKAMELDTENVIYAINTANLYYRKFSIYGQKPAIYKAVEIAKDALTLPDAVDKPGPRQGANRLNRISLYAFLANCYIEQVLEPCEVRTEDETREWLANAEQVVHEIEQLIGSGEDPYVIQWQGMLELAKGNRNEAVRKLYAAYEQIKASGIEDAPPSLFQRSYAQLSYFLAKVFEDTPELGAVGEFLSSSLKTGINRLKPQVILDYSEVLLELRNHNAALTALNFFESEYWTNERSQTLRADIYIAARQFNEAEEELAKRQPDDPNTVKLNLALVQAKIEQLQKVIEAKKMQEDLGDVFKKASEIKKEIESQTAELKSHSLLRAELLEKLLMTRPDLVGEDSIVAVCDDYIAKGKIKRAEDLVNRFLQYFPANTKVLLCKQILAESEPAEISQQRREQIEEQVLSNIADPKERATKLGVFYQEHDKLDKAVGEFQKVLKMDALQEDAVYQAEEITDSQRLAADHLLEIALDKQDWNLAEQIVKIAQGVNLDGCESQFFAARLAMAKGEYENALTMLEESLKQQPVFSKAFLLKSKANTALGNELESIDDVQRAASLNPFDGAIAEELAFVLYERNRKLGDNATSDQIIESGDALRRAVVLNRDNPELLSFYAEYIATTDPFTALAVRKNLQKTNPSIQNAVLLGRMATRMATSDKNAERREALSAMAASAFEQARGIDPENKLMLMYYAEYLQATGRAEEASQLLRESDDQRLLWAHYLQAGEIEDAKKILEQSYQTGEKDISTVKGLLLVAEKEGDEKAIKKYSEELISFADTAENRLLQTQMFLNVGLIKEAEHKLESFKEKFPDEHRILLLEALLQMKQGRLKEALELTNKGLETFQQDSMAWRLRGQINLLMANYEQAIIDLKRSKSLSDEPVTRIALARAYQRAARYEDAITELKAMTTSLKAPARARTLLEQLYWRLGRKKELKEFYDEILKKFPDSVLWHNRAGEFAIAIGDTERAEQLYKQASEKSRDKGVSNSAAVEGYLGALLAGGKLDKVFEEASKYVDGDLAPVAFVKMAEAELKLGDKETAIKYLRRALDKAGGKEAVMTNILKIMYMLLGAEEVQTYCQEMLETNPNSLIANTAMFNLKKINGDYDSALNYIDKCLQIIGPDSPQRDVYISRKVETLTLAYAQTSDNNYLKSAIVEYESLLVKMPNNPGVLNNLAYLLAEENIRLGEALEYAKRAYDLRPNNPNFLDTYSYVLYKNGKFSEAAEFLQSALQLYEQRNISVSATVYEHLGMIKEKLGSLDEAIAAYEQVLEIGADGLQEAVRERIELAIQRLSSQSETNK